jgi:PKD repeat protein
MASCAPTVVNFNDLSSGADSWLWDFGDGGTSVLQDPVHIYNQPGIYDITLSITDSIGCTDTLTMPDLVHITGSVAMFGVSATSGCSPWQVTFSDSSISAFSWLWNFGDGNSSTLQNPVHTYSSAGTYTVTLMTQDTSGCQSVWSGQTPVTILQPPVAEFSTADTLGCAPYNVQFASASLNAASYLWDFGDGITSSAAAPSHTYTQPGVYSVSLMVSSPDGCSDTIVYADLVKVGLTPQPSFVSPVTSGCPPLSIQFTNTTIDTVGGIVYSWNFGNGTSSQNAQPSVTYTLTGVYDVTLQAVNPLGCSAVVTMPAYIQVQNNAPLPPVQLRSASVLDTGAVEITWANLAVQNMQAYELYRLNSVSGNYDLIYTDVNPGNSNMNVNSVYVDSLLNTTDYSYTYVARAVNECGVATPMSSLASHSTVNVTATEQNGDVAVSWNSYGGCSVASYEVLRQEYLSGPFVAIATVPGSVTSFFDTTLYCSMQVAYLIRATSLCGLPYDAFSDTSVADVPGTIVSQPVDVVRSTVVEDDFVLTEWAPPVQMPQTVTGYEIYRSNDGGNFTLLDVVSAMQTSYEDRTVNVHEGNYFYRVKVVNICQLDAGMGSMGASIWLQTDIDADNISNLRWTKYEDWDTGVDYYVIERMDTMGMWRQVGTVPGSRTDYTDR